ncbi:hypothetical protein KL86CLO1_11418 [uncultured Eubacteriales bacterium]|uniref:Uncharacterized protein n=1 Tax=uncultured Eubacteriales bacterium TaxID=172733 RepID=A0A212JNH7_9FIRM|nr:hypothetical protein KL86CLO1_11418 [uncultured Eubacteriales bacterium]
MLSSCHRKVYSENQLSKLLKRDIIIKDDMLSIKIINSMNKKEFFNKYLLLLLPREVK